jgi:hypothetical protein
MVERDEEEQMIPSKQLFWVTMACMSSGKAQTMSFSFSEIMANPTGVRTAITASYSVVEMKRKLPHA